MKYIALFCFLCSVFFLEAQITIDKNDYLIANYTGGNSFFAYANWRGNKYDNHYFIPIEQKISYKLKGDRATQKDYLLDVTSDYLILKEQMVSYSAIDRITAKVIPSKKDKRIGIKNMILGGLCVVGGSIWAARLKGGLNPGLLLAPALILTGTVFLISGPFYLGKQKSFNVGKNWQLSATPL